MDSGATHHLIKKEYEENLINSKNLSQEINVARKGENLKVIKEGDMSLKSETSRKIKIKNVWVCKDLSHNLLSVRKLEDAGLETIFKGKEEREISRKF